MQLPDYPHDIGGGASNARSWFYLGRSAPQPGGNAEYLGTIRTSDGGITVDQILDISGMPRLDALRIMYQLLDQRVISLGH